MPRTSRLDLQDALYHVIARGVGRGPIFKDDLDRVRFLDRMASLVPAQDISLFAYVLMTNHFHLVLRRASLPLAKFMSRLLTGHAVVFNLRHNRSGHVFQNRYRSILCETDTYFLELIRYVHLNPVRARIVQRPEHYRWSSHQAYLNEDGLEWLDRNNAMEALGGRKSYERFVNDGIGGVSQPELSGYATNRVDGQELRLWHRGKILGTEEFAKAVLERAQRPVARLLTAEDHRSVEAVAASVSRYSGVSVAAIRGRSRRAEVARARLQVIHQAVEVEGLRPVDVSHFLNLSRGAISHSLRRANAWAALT